MSHDNALTGGACATKRIAEPPPMTHKLRLVCSSRTLASNVDAIEVFTPAGHPTKLGRTGSHRLALHLQLHARTYPSGRIQAEAPGGHRNQLRANVTAAQPGLYPRLAKAASIQG